MSVSTPVHNTALILRYDGTAYHGWQSQKNALAISDIVSRCIAAATGLSLTDGDLQGCGRTDAGVHALCYTANFKSRASIPFERFPLALNPLLPEDIAALAAYLVPDGFHARFSCTRKEYIYKIYQSSTPDPFLRNRAYMAPVPLDITAMREAAAQFVGTHDFSAFRNLNGKAVKTVKHIYWCDIRVEDPGLVIAVCADGFLYNMVRVIAGTLVYIGMGKLSSSDITLLLNGGSREDGGITAPPHGLYLSRLWYENGDTGTLPCCIGGETAPPF